jgi:DnaK suppressor protein
MNKKLTKKQLDHFKNLFTTQREEIIDFCKKNQAVSPIDLDGDEIDAIQANILHTIDSKILEREALKINKITAALNKIEDGFFGDCEDCGELIAIKRLEALPLAEFCILCAEKAELEAKMFLLKNS